MPEGGMSKQDVAQRLLPGLARLRARDWVRAAPWQAGLQRMEAFFSGAAYAPHRHDTYSICYTIRGAQSFDYRGARSNSTPGKVIVLHPDEVHNGEAGSAEGFLPHPLYRGCHGARGARPRRHDPALRERGGLRRSGPVPGDLGHLSRHGSRAGACRAR